MSAYIRMATPMIDRECLIEALGDMGFGRDKLVVNETPAALVGYQGRRRKQTAEIVIPRVYVGRASNDIGFVRTAHGYQAVISQYDSQTYGRAWLSQLASCYRARENQRHLEAVERAKVERERKRLVEAQRQAVYERAEKMGYMVKETRTEDKVRLVLVKRSY